MLGIVDELVDQNDVAWRVLRLKRADCAGADDPRDAQLFHRPDVGSMVEFAGHDAVPTTVPREKDDIPVLQLAGQEFIRGAPKRRVDRHPLMGLKAFDFVQSTTANDPDLVHAATALSHGTRETK